MKIALIGYGKMGQMVEKAALGRGHSIVARITTNDWDTSALQQADVCIEFTQPDSVVENLKKVAELKKDMVIGTTGWQNQLDVVQTIVKTQNIGCLYSSNFSIGIALFLEIVAQASKLMNAFDDYDVAGLDIHHNQKKDSPSGTALTIAKAIENSMSRITQVPFSSIRCGSVPGTHSVIFDSPCDTITLTHEARNREGFALGAVQSAEWLHGRKGMYTFADCIHEMLKGGHHET